MTLSPQPVHTFKGVLAGREDIRGRFNPSNSALEGVVYAPEGRVYVEHLRNYLPSASAGELVVYRHADTPTFEQVGAGIGHLHSVPDHMRQGRFDHLPGVVRLQPFGKTGHGPVPRSRGDESEQETGSGYDPGMLDEFRLWGSRRWRQMTFHPFDGGEEIEHGSDPATHNAFLSEGGALAVVVEDFRETPHQTRNDTDVPRRLLKGEARLRLACPPPRLAQRRAAREGCWW